MCTLTWQRHNDELTIWFNRDEQKLRPEAHPPRTFTWDNTQVVAPIDPPSGGSWITGNQFGISIALLNWYVLPNIAGKISRGKLVKKLASLRSLSELSPFVRDEDFSVYAPFQCAIFDQSNQQLIRWNGDNLTAVELPPIVTSSSVDTEATISRREAIHQLYGSNLNAPFDFLAFHQHHDNEFPMQSVCVHRQHSRTMSHTQIRTTSQYLTMRYYDGFPCAITPTTPSHELILSLQETS